VTLQEETLITRKAAVTPRRGGLSHRQRERLIAYSMLTPALLVVLALMLYPLYLALDISFRDGQSINLADLQASPRTTDNYSQVLGNSETWQAAWRSFVYTAGSTLPAFAIGLGTAILLNQRFPGRRIARPLMLLPWPIPGIAISVIFLWLLDSSYGIVNSLLRRMGIIDENISWFIDANAAMAAVIVPTVWKYYPFFTLILLAALQNVPQDLYEVARVDGASRLRQFTSVTWPAIRGSAVLSIVIGGLGIFREFDVIFPLTGGGPVKATETLVIGLYNEAFRYHNLPVASAIGMVAMCMAGVVVLALSRQMRKEFF
jgi:multiple sugar transport system permease protein